MKGISAEILCVGTELLLGDIINTNAAYLSVKLSEIGISVFHQTVIGDNAARMSEAVRVALERSDVVITSGGLGPTYDDITKETIAEAVGVDMYYDKSVADRIHEYFEKIGRAMPPSNEKQAMVPNGAHVIYNPRGTAPGLILDCKYMGADKTVIMLPGPPCELEPMTDESIIPFLCEKFNAEGSVFYSLNLHFVGIGESSLEQIIRPVMDSKNPTVAPYAGEGEVRLRITASADDMEKAEGMCRQMKKEILSYGVGKYLYSDEYSSLEETLVRILAKNKMTLSCAESCTGGLISKRITDVSGASEVFLGGVCSYAESVKESVLGVPRSVLEEHSAVSEQTARLMAEGVRRITGADIGVSTTGYAGPSGGTEKDPVGTVYIAVATKEKTLVKRVSYSGLRDRVFIRRAASSYAMGLVLSLLGNEDFDIR